MNENRKCLFGLLVASMHGTWSLTEHVPRAEALALGPAVGIERPLDVVGGGAKEEAHGEHPRRTAPSLSHSRAPASALFPLGLCID
jgi:hypothetical protein